MKTTFFYFYLALIGIYLKKTPFFYLEGKTKVPLSAGVQSSICVP